MVRTLGALTGFLLFPVFPAWASLRGAEQRSNETQQPSAPAPVPSRITGCPTGYMDCGTCLCVPATTCDMDCVAAVPNLPSNPAPPAQPTPPSNGEPVPSTIRGCPAGYVDCGSCFCTPRSTCDACNATPPTLWPGLPLWNETNGTNGTNWTNWTNYTNWTNQTNATVPQLNYTPSRVPYCPQGYVDCGTCVCVPLGTCAYCPGAWSPAPGQPVGVVPRPSQVPGCPANYYDCGTCQCVPHSTCQWCPAGGSVPFPGRPVPAPAPPSSPATPVPSRVPGCPANYYDCGTCQCVPRSTCQWCPGSSAPAPAPAPGNPSPPTGAVPSTIIGCPANYYDCGSCRCVPRGTCQWCGGVSFVALEGANSSHDRTLRI